jgi:hypothetical protein
MKYPVIITEKFEKLIIVEATMKKKHLTNVGTNFQKIVYLAIALFQFIIIQMKVK